MKREEMKEWADGLKTGDKVVRTGWWDERPVEVLTVERLTKTGRVVTNKGTYAMISNWSSRYKGYGDAEGTIIPATTENIKLAEEYQREEEERKRTEATIRKAKGLAYKLYYGDIEMTYELARKIIQVVRGEIG